METYIAIKTPARLSRAGLSQSADTPQKRTFLRQEALGQSLRRQKLIERGFEEIPVEQTLKGSLEPKPRSSFSRLGHVGAYVLNVSNREEFKEVEEFLGEDYQILPDIKLSLPATEVRGILGQSSRGANWPEPSGIEKAHQNGLKGEEIIIAVLDTGCDADHVQFSKKLIDYRYFSPNSPQLPLALRGFDPDGHGTHVCGIIAGRSLGIAPAATLMVGSVIESERTSTSLMRIVAALEWVSMKAIEPGNEQKAIILNLSLGFRPRDVRRGTERVLLNGMRDLLTTLIEGYDILPVVAIGNDGSGQYRFPAAFPEALAVGAIDSRLNPWLHSSGGTVNLDGLSSTKPDLVGYGVNIYSSLWRTIEGHSRYQKKSGTSMATPYVTGIAALIAQEHGLRGQALRQKLLEEALPLEHPPDRVGAGLARFQ